MAQSIQLRVSRYSPERDTQPYFQTYEVPLKEEWVILDALNYIKDKIDGTLTFRWSCRMGICGSCGYMVNNEPKLGCATFLTQYTPGPVIIEPLKNFPIVRDWVIEISDFLEKLKKVKPWLIHDDGNESGEYLQTPDQLEEFRQYSMCINCLLCYAACPISGLDPVFVGPAALALAHRYNKDSRDQGSAERPKALHRDACAAGRHHDGRGRRGAEELFHAPASGVGRDAGCGTAKAHASPGTSGIAVAGSGRNRRRR